MDIPVESNLSTKYGFERSWLTCTSTKTPQNPFHFLTSFLHFHPRFPDAMECLSTSSYKNDPVYAKPKYSLPAVIAV